jgi:hypothetical protein
MFKFHSWQGVLDTTFCDKVCKQLAALQWFSLGTPVSSTNKTDFHDKVESGIKHHNPNPNVSIGVFIYIVIVIVAMKSCINQHFNMLISAKCK